MSAETGPGTPGASPRPSRGYLLPGTIALLVLSGGAAVFGVLAIQTHFPHRLAGPEVAGLLADDLQVQARHGVPDPPEVRCPTSEPDRRGVVFDCALLRPGRPKATIRVTETSGTGDFSYEVLPAG